MQENRTGHCYLELADKQEGEEKVRAVARGTIWSFTYRMLKPYFETTAGRPLEKGMKVLINAEVVFHELYGFSLNIKDIDPAFTLGDLERKKREILGQLEREGVIDMNRNLEMAPLPKNIAVISSPTAAGLGDFLNHLAENPYGYRFYVKLFPAVMQGEKTTTSVIEALERIYEYEALFDAVVLIRGGGSQSDLGSFDTYDLAANIAQFPLPVIAGIGHDRDDTLVDWVAWLKVKTPTAAAAFLIDSFARFEGRLQELQQDFVQGVMALVREERSRQEGMVIGFRQWTALFLQERENRLQLLSGRLRNGVRSGVERRLTVFGLVQNRITGKLALLFDRQRNRIDRCTDLAGQRSRELFSRNKHRLELAETKMKYADPEHVLQRGYSITCIRGKALKSVSEAAAGEVLETFLKDGRIESTVIK